MSTNFNYIAAGFNTGVAAVNDIRNSALIGIGLFLVTLPFLRSKKSFFDAAAAKKLLIPVRFVSLIEVFWLVPLLYCVISFGSPIRLGPYTPYGVNNSWIYGFGRPCMGIVLINFGMVAGMHPAPRVSDLSLTLSIYVHLTVSVFDCLFVSATLCLSVSLSCPPVCISLLSFCVSLYLSSVSLSDFSLHFSPVIFSPS